MTTLKFILLILSLIAVRGVLSQVSVSVSVESSDVLVDSSDYYDDEDETSFISPTSLIPTLIVMTTADNVVYSSPPLMSSPPPVMSPPPLVMNMSSSLSLVMSSSSLSNETVPLMSPTPLMSPSPVDPVNNTFTSLPVPSSSLVTNDTTSSMIPLLQNVSSSYELSVTAHPVMNSSSIDYTTSSHPIPLSSMIHSSSVGLAVSSSEDEFDMLSSSMEYEFMSTNIKTTPLITPMVSSSSSAVVSTSSSAGVSSSSSAVVSSSSPLLASTYISSSISSSLTTSSSSRVSTTDPTIVNPSITVDSTTTSTASAATIGAVAGASAALLLIIIISATPLIIVLVLGRRRRKHKKKPKDYWASVDANRHLGSAANVTMGFIAPLPRPNQISRVSLVSKGHYLLESLSKPLSVQELGDSLYFKGKLHDQYMSIPANMTGMNEIPSGAQEKNRYCDVLPNPNSRVVLFLKFGVANSDYINANFIRGYRGQPKAYIATQGPLSFTVADFWRMVWEQRTTVIIMTTGLNERNMVKCNQYWPDAQGYGITELYGEIQVTIRKRDVKNSYIVTTFTVQHIERGVTREIIHYWYVKWPDMGVPEEPSSIVDFLLDTRRSRESFTMPGPTVVHCSAGIGRTGVFIGADIGMRELEETQSVDVLRIVASMRQDRGGMVQTKDQFVFLHKVLYEYAKRMGFVVPQMRGLGEASDNEDDDYEMTSPNALLPDTTVTFF